MTRTEPRNDIRQPSPAEVRQYIHKAHRLRAAYLATGVKRIAQRLRAAGPAAGRNLASRTGGDRPGAVSLR